MIPISIPHLYKEDKKYAVKAINDNFIGKYNFTPNRYNVLTYIFFLNDSYNEHEIILNVSENELYNIKAEKGKLVLFPENKNYPYKCNLSKNNIQYIISGQLYYNNMI